MTSDVDMLKQQIVQVLDFNTDENTGGFSKELRDYYTDGLLGIAKAAESRGYANGINATPPSQPLPDNQDTPAKIAFDFLPIDHKVHKAKLEQRINALLLRGQS